jgi:hypothetical protein
MRCIRNKRKSNLHITGQLGNIYQSETEKWTNADKTIDAHRKPRKSARHRQLKIQYKYWPALNQKNHSVFRRHSFASHNSRRCGGRRILGLVGPSKEKKYIFFNVEKSTKSLIGNNYGFCLLKRRKERNTRNLYGNYPQFYV